MSSVTVRPARADEGAFLAVAMEAADRGHTGVGTWDVMLPDADDRRAVMTALAAASQPSYVHWSTFLVAEVDGTPAATVAGYVPARTTSDMFDAACREVLGARADAVLGVHGAWSRDYFRVEIPDDALRVEWVYTATEYRTRGLSVTLIEGLLDDAWSEGLTKAYVGTYIGNSPAIATYRRAGFREFAECRQVDYEDRFATPGLVVLRRRL